MYQENITPGCDLDEHLFKVLRAPLTGLTSSAAGEVPAAVHDFLRRLPEHQAGRAAVLWVELAERMAGLGLPLASWVAFQQGLGKCARADERAVIHDRRADMLERHGYGFRAAADRRNAARMRRLPPPGRITELEEDGLAVVSCQGEAAEFARFAATVDSPLRRDPLRDPGLAKAAFHATRTDRWGLAVDLSFFVVDAGYRPILQVECDVLGDDVMACRNTGIVLTPLAPAAEAAFPLALRQVLVNAHWLGVEEIMVQTWDDDDVPAVHDWLAEHRAMMCAMRHARVDLRRPMADILADFRQTHRNLTRWGLANLHFASSFADSPPALVHAYHQLAVRDRRGQIESEAVLGQRLERGEISLHAAGHGASPETMVLVSYCGGDIAYYGGAVRIRDQGKSSAPALMYRIMAELRERGIAEFVLGDLLDGAGGDAKMHGIAAFKAGFTKSFRPGKWGCARSGMMPSCLDLEG